MILVYADCSHDDPILSVGYVVYRANQGDETLLDTGTRVLNTQSHERDVTWCNSRGEYFAAIVGVRAALDYTNEPLVLHLDNDGVVEAIKTGENPFESYFQHALQSFLPRFDDYHVRSVHRETNEAAHRQARVGLQIGRDIQRGVV